MKYKVLFFLMAILGWTSVSAQTLTVKGTVTSATDGETLIGATVKVKGQNIAAATDLDGNYTLLNVPQKAVLMFSYVGFEPMEVNVDGRSEINVSMKEQSSELNELVVVGYGVAKRSDLTSSISTVKGDEITEVTTGNAMTALQGKVSGVQIASAGGPGATPKVIIRGITSVNGSTPLYVVDGVPMNSDNINFLNNNDIESMEVLKDASASAIYGTRASNGVILVTTKKGKAGKTHVNFSASVGFDHVPKPEIAWADEYEKVFKARYTNDGRTPLWQSPYKNYSEVDGTNWWNEVVNETALIQNYSLNVRGGNEKFVYSISAGYYNNKSQFDYGYWDKLNVRLNTEYTFNQYLKAGLDMAPTMENWDNSPNLFEACMSMDPTTPIYRPESQWNPANPMDNYQRSYNNQTWNPAGSLARMDNHTRAYTFLLNPYIQVNPIKQLTFRTQFGANIWFQRNDYFDVAFDIDALEKRELNQVGRNYKDGTNWSWSNTLTYMETFAEKHNLTAMVGFTAERYVDWWNAASRADVPGNSDLLHEVDAGVGEQKSGGSKGSNSLASFLGRVMYNYDGRYYLTASVRTDGSSRFPKGNKYATFPSVSVAWRFSQEKFMENTRGWLDNAKIRLGWGKVGNQNISSDAYITLMNNGVNYVYGTTPVRYPSAILGNTGNPNLHWETVEDIDLGIEASLFSSRLNFTFDLFQKTSHDMLYGKQSALLLGLGQWYGSVTQNIGEMRARGWELAINWRDKVGDFRYDIGLQLSSVRNKGLMFSGDGPILEASNILNNYIIRNEDGGLISRFFGYKTDGIFQNWSEVLAHSDQHGNLIQPNAQPGDIKFLDLNNDGQLTDEDKRFIGNPYPDLTLGLNMNFYYKNFDLTANFYGTFGNDIFNVQRNRYSGNGGSNVFRGAYEKSWRGEGTSNEFPRLSYNDLNQNWSTVSDFYVEDGSYLRCKLLTLGYTLPSSFMRDYKLRFYVSAQNLFTITKYTGMDPEAPFADGGCLAVGINKVQYPTPQTFLFGVDFSF
ncbi:MAG: TonB-dependent receptor [Muribaculaceae bacterium]|nr:TonB-dependent receptor [Muribaculaceae bacterium]